MRWVLPLAIAAAVLVSACGGGDNGAPTPTPSAEPSASSTVTVSPTASPTPTPTPATKLITRGPDTDLSGMALIIETGCFGCDGGPGGLVRVYSDDSGQIHQDDLLGALQNSLPKISYDTPNGTQEYPASINGLVMTQDASVMAVSFCIKGTCAYSGLVGYDADSIGVAFRSLDGGVTWQEMGRGGPVFKVGAVLADGRVLIGHGAADNAVNDYYFLPGGAPVAAPSIDSATYVYPITTPNEILWGTNDGRLLRFDGRLLFQLPFADYLRSVAGTFRNDNGYLAVSWRLPEPTPRPTDYRDRYVVAELNLINGEARVVRQWEIDSYIAYLGSLAPEMPLVLSVADISSDSYGFPVPALIGFDSGEIDYIPKPFVSDTAPYAPFGRTYVRAVQPGAFARIVNTNSCLNIREQPSLSAPVLTCMVDGILLRDLDGGTRITDGAEWVSVMTPGETQGWASAAFLER